METMSNCRVGRDLEKDDCFVLDCNTSVKIWGFDKQAPEIDGVKPDFRIAQVTIGNHSILRSWAIHDTVFYQLCNR